MLIVHPYYSSYIFCIPVLFAIYNNQYTYASLISILAVTSIINHGLFFDNHYSIVLFDRAYASCITIYFTIKFYKDAQKEKDNIFLFYTAYAGFLAILMFIIAKVYRSNCSHVLMHMSGLVAFMYGIQARCKSDLSSSSFDDI